MYRRVLSRELTWSTQQDRGTLGTEKVAAPSRIGCCNFGWNGKTAENSLHLKKYIRKKGKANA